MPLSFVKKNKAAAPPPPPEPEAKPVAVAKKAGKPVAKVAAPATEAKKGKKQFSFLKKGAAAVQAFEQAEADAEQQALEMGKAWRFLMKEKTQATLTFLDGEFDPVTKMLDVPVWHEHTIKVNGRWRNYVCTKDHEPCPLCEDNNKRAFVAGLTIIDHRTTKTKDGKEFRNQKRLYVCKRGTFKQLAVMAEKYGGLTMVEFDVSRTDEKKANVGDVYMYTKKWDIDEFKEEYSLEDTAEEDAVAPLDYNEAVPYLTAAELQKLGFLGGTGIGNESDDDLPEGKAITGDDV